VVDTDLVVFAVALAVVLFLSVLLHVCDSEECDEIAVSAVIVLVVFLMPVFALAVASWMRLFLS